MMRISQKVLLVVILLSLAMSVGLPAGAAPDKQGSSQDRMKACNNLADNKGLKGDDRKNFVQDCLSKGGGNQKLDEMSQKDKMNTCKNIADKRNLKGSDRRSFIKDCMNKANPK